MHLQSKPQAVSHKLRTMFIHVPKNAGTSGLKALGMDVTAGHRTWHEYKVAYPVRWYFYFRFAIIRNPWDRVVSNYLYARMKRSFWHSPDGTTQYSTHPDYETLRDASFQSCVELIPTLKHPGWKPQSHWVCGPGGKNKMDYLCRYENLAHDFAHVCKKLRVRADLPLINSSDDKDARWQDFYDENTAALVRRLYAVDIENFGYEFAEDPLRRLSVKTVGHTNARSACE